MKDIKIKEKMFMNLFRDNNINLKYLNEERKTSICWLVDCEDCVNVDICVDRELHKWTHEELEYILEKYPEARVVI